MYLQLTAQRVNLQSTLDEIETRFDDLLLELIQLPCFEENMLTHAHFAEIVQHSGIAKFFELFLVESNPCVKAGIRLGNSASQPTGKGRHTLAVPAGSRVP